MKKPFQFLTAMLVCFILISGGCDDKQQNTETKPQTNMNPSNKSNYNLSDYDTDWKKVDSLERQGLLKSALEVVNSIMERAQKEDNQPVQIKGFIYQLKYNQSLEENDFSNALTRIDKMRLTAKAPVKQILASIKGEMLWMYYTNNRYNFYNRSTTTNFDLGDVSTWDLKTLLDTSFKLYEESLLDASQLQQIPTSNFDYIITKKDSTAYLNAPTIYDFLANRALSFFENDETGITRPGEKFKVNDDSYFGNSTVFSQIKLESKDTMSTHLHYIQVMQELTRFHQSEKYPTAQLRNELRRLKFVYNKSTIANKDELYEQALKTLQTSFKENPVFSEINAHLAQHYYNLGASSEANSPHYSKIKEAYDLCEKTIAQYPKTSGATFCSSLITNIQQPYLAAQIEKYTASKTPILTKISYNNLSKVTVQIYKKNSSDDTYYYELKDKLKNTKLIESKEYDLPKITNFQKQTTEIALNELEHGNYIILVSTNPEKIDDKQYNHWAADFQITDMSFSLRGINSKKSALQVFDRTTSVGIANATVHVYETKYNYTTRKSERRKIASYKTDAKGYAAIDHFDDRYGKYIEVVNGKDQLTSSAHLSNYTYQQDTYQTDNLFTDRSIYRPGQTVYFKGIRLETVNKKSKIKSDASVKAIFKDVNYQEVSSLQLKTNDFGSFEGSFRIPTTGITGQMTIQTEHGMVYFSVEEYKRPTFKVEIEKSKEEYKLGDIIAVKGKAVAYAGNAIDDAQVSYVVKRQLIMPYWCRYYYGITPINSEQTIIKEGAIKTNQQGAFDLKFKSEKDNSSHSKYLNYVYTIEVDVTDANGETRSTLKHLTISESSMNLSVSMKESLEKNEKNSIQVNALNAEGQEINASGSIIISKLKPKAEVLRSRVWDFPSKPLLSDAEYKKLFPNMELKTIKQDEREIEATIPRLYFNTEKSSTVELNTSNWKTGEYKIEFVATDKDGNEVKNVQYVTVTDSKSTSVPFGSIFHAYTLKSTFEPGETATVVVASSMMNQKVIAELNVDGVIV
ncbi:MAG TPA: MG2 domain-containing protein, partial [Taishania sp.]|nr:MG2 domain-containing protein [Taishania sp.]